MVDPRIVEHAKVLVRHSTKVGKGDSVLIAVTDPSGIPLAVEVYKETVVAGGSPLIIAMPSDAVRGHFKLASEEYLKIFPKHYFELVKASDVVINIRSDENTRFLADIDPKRMSIRDLTLRQITEERLRKRWCVTQYPTSAYAQEADMSLEEYEDFLYSAVLRDWAKELKQMTKLKKIMDKTDQVQIVGEKTNLTMSIKGRIAVIDSGEHNMPGGEIFTAPVDDTANGEIYFDLPAIRYGKEIRDVWLKLESGVIADYSASKNEDFLKTMINTDAGSKKLGELGIGTNRGITKFTRNILFDEKIAGTIHIAIGMAYKECLGKNESAIHLDLIKTIKPGKVIMDGKVVLEEGKLFWEK